VNILRSRRLRWVARAVLWAVAGSIVVGGISVGATAALLPSCASCHLSGDAKTGSLSASHSKVDCESCHVGGDLGSRVSFAAYEVLGMALHAVPPSGRAGAAVADSRCLTCHAGVARGVSDSGGLRVKHSVCAEGSECSDCHAQVAHGPGVKWPRGSRMSMCLECHGARRASTSCATCHTSRPLAAGNPPGSWSVTHGPNWKTTHGMGDLATCVGCHAPDSCVRCHHLSLPHDRGFMRTHGTTARAQLADCTVCHQETFCRGCHRLEMPHPRGFVPAHGRTVRSQGDSRCLRCHAQSDCETCHVKHMHPGGAAASRKVSSPGDVVQRPPAGGE
jgi:hypothetical protein